jgi:HD-like signal output (HDOD) protein
MIAAMRSGIGYLVGHLFGWARARHAPPLKDEVQRSRAEPRDQSRGEGGPGVAVHAEVATRRFTALTLDATLSDLRELVTPADLAALEPVTRVLSDLKLQARFLPRRPLLLPRLMSAISNDTTGLREMAKIIGDDGTLLGGLLKLANSSRYWTGTNQPIDSLEKAVVLVGTDGLRSLVATALLHPVMTSTHRQFASFAEITWEHSQFAAACAEQHATRIEGADAFGARLLVLLRGLASNTVFRIAREVCISDDASVRPAAMAKLLDEWVPRTALRIAEEWQLPAELCQALAAPQGAGLARSVRFGYLAGALLLLVNRSCMRELSARAIVLADDHRRTQVDQLWSRLAIAHLAAGRTQASGTWPAANR